MVRKILQRLIVKRGQPVTEQRGLSIAENLDHEIARRDRAQEYRLAPHRRRQRNGNELARSGSGRGALAELLPEDLRSDGFAIRTAVKEAGELADEPRAIGDGMDVERGGERRPSAGNRYVLGNGRGGGEMRR